MKQPDFQNLLDALARKPGHAPVLFDFPLGPAHIERLTGSPWQADADTLTHWRNGMRANLAAGYDYAWITPWHAGFINFPGVEREQGQSVGMAEGGIIHDWASFEAYPWPDPEADRWELADRFAAELPDGVRCLMMSDGGMLEGVIRLLAYEPLCMLLEDDPALVQAVTDRIGERLLRYYQRGLQCEAVGAVMVNDDWGFKTQPFLPPELMRQYITPWHKRIVAAIHASGRPAILHSCGELKLLWDDIIEDIGFQAKHSYEDTILPVEEAYERYHSRIALFGGIDMDFLCRETPETVYRRCKAMLERSHTRGGYALGSGNSVPDYVPGANHAALCRAVVEG